MFSGPPHKSATQVMNYRAAIICLTVLTVGGTSHVSALEILAPGEHISTSRSRITIIGHATAPSLSIYLNDEFYGEVPVQDSVFHARVRIPWGLNKIRITGAADGARPDATEDSIEVLCGPRFSRDQSRFFDEYRFHEQQRPQACRGCHGSDGEQQAAGKGEWCYPCHNDVRQRLRDHIVDETRPCTGCHMIGKDLRASMRASAESNPCLQCHTDKIGLLAKNFVHGPVAGGTCTICHDPHGSQFARTLVRPVPVLCEGCHGAVSGTTLPVQHHPFAQGWCVDCHDPHATNHKWGLLRESQSLCLGCHFTDASQKAHRHPYGVKPINKKKLAPHLALGSDGKLECLTCHAPHASATAFLLRTDNVNKCLGCHPERT